MLTYAKNSSACTNNANGTHPALVWRQLQMSSAHRAARGISAACGHPHRAGAYTAALKPLIFGTQAKRGPCDRGVCAYPSPRPRGGAPPASAPPIATGTHAKRGPCMLSEACTRCCDQLRYSATSCPVLPAALPYVRCTGPCSAFAKWNAVDFFQTTTCPGHDPASGAFSAPKRRAEQCGRGVRTPCAPPPPRVSCSRLRAPSVCGQAARRGAPVVAGRSPAARAQSRSMHRTLITR